MRTVLLAWLLVALSAGAARADRFLLTYDGMGLGFVPLGSVVVDAEVSEDSYLVSARLSSRGLLNLFEPTDIQAEAAGSIASGVVRWSRYALDHHYSRKRRTISMLAGDDGAISALIEPGYRLWGDPPASDEQRRRSRDPLSSMIAMAVDVGQTRRCAGDYPTFYGRFHYLLELGGGDVDRFRDAGFAGDVLKCSLAYIAVSGFEARDAGRRRIPQGQVWFALMPDTRFAPPVQIATPISAGAAVIRLSDFRRARVDVVTNPAAP